MGIDAAIIELGDVSSCVVDAFLAGGFRALTVPDLSEKAFTASNGGLGSCADCVITRIVADTTDWQPAKIFGAALLRHQRQLPQNICRHRV